MGFKEEFSSASGWNVADTNRKTNTPQGAKFLDFLKENGVTTVIRYYASTPREKTLSQAEAQALTAAGFFILPVYQDRARDVSDFGGANGEVAARNALAFAASIGQPEGTTILFAVDIDLSQTQIDRSVVPFFTSIKSAVGGRYRIGAYASGATLATLSAAGLIEVPWITMSRLFLGTREFFTSGDWAMRQIPPEMQHPGSGFGFDRNLSRWTPERLGAFRLGQPVAEVPRTEAAVGGSVRHVATEGLKFRDVPNGTEIRDFTLNEVVEDLGPAGTEGWRRIRADGREGVAFGKYLRAPAAPEIEALVAAAVAEWVRFEKGKGKEGVQPFRGFVGEMWTSIGFPDRDGKTDLPWSAAFISFVVRKAGPKYANFKFAAAHSVFVHDAIQARILSNRAKPFWGYRITEKRPEIGDIIQRSRGGTSVSFGFAETNSQYASHSDIVVEVRDDLVRVIGGNIGDSVTTEAGDDRNLLQEYDLTEDGFLKPGQRIIALLKNRTPELP